MARPKRRTAVLAGAGACTLALGFAGMAAPAAAWAAPGASDTADNSRSDAPKRSGAGDESSSASRSTRASQPGPIRRGPTVADRRTPSAAPAASSPARSRSVTPSPERTAASVRTPAATEVPADRPSTTAAPETASPSSTAPAAPAATTQITAAPTAPVARAAAVGTAATPDPIGDFISGALLMVRRLFFNQAPVASPVQGVARPSGKEFGFLAASDPEGDPIAYAVKDAPTFGTVSITANGTYAYTPGPGFTGTDSFTVTVDDLGDHINLLDWFGPNRRDVTITIGDSGPNPAGTVIDTFDGPAGSAPDPKLWGYHLGPWRDAGLQTYTDSPDNVRLDGQGNLLIQARNTPDGYTSTRLVTQDKLEMQYGVLQARIKLPAGQGIWPAFWTLGTSYRPEQPEGWPECGEIDIIEVVNTGTQYTVALHGPQGDTDYYGGAEASGQFVGNQGPIAAVAPITDLTADYHDYWLMWREDQIVIGVDDTMLGEFTPASLPEGAEWVFNQPMYGILQIAVGGPWPGPPDETTPWPATMAVDSFSYRPLA